MGVFKLPPEFMAIVDTREQLPLALNIPNERGTLKTGDYSVRGLEDKIAIERKSFMDLLGCIGGQRRRFEECIDRLLEIPCRAIVVEGTWKMLEELQLSSGWRSHLHPNAAVGSVMSWISRGIPILMLDNPRRASDYVSRLLVHGYKRYGTNLVEDDHAEIPVPKSSRPRRKPNSFDLASSGS
jgi:ERCC4-type nuclease